MKKVVYFPMLGQHEPIFYGKQIELREDRLLALATLL
jgi:hypothetical protein